MAMVLLSLALLTISFEAVDGESIGGEGAATYHTVTFYSGDQVLKTESVLSGSKVTTPTIDYPVLANWCIGSIEGDAFDQESKITSDLDLYAKYVDCSLGLPHCTFVNTNVLLMDFMGMNTNASNFTIDWGDGIVYEGSGNPTYIQHEYSGNPYVITIRVWNPTSSAEISIRMGYKVTFHSVDDTISEVVVKESETVDSPAGYCTTWRIGSVGGVQFDFQTPITQDLELFETFESPKMAACVFEPAGDISGIISCSVGHGFTDTIFMDWGDGTKEEYAVDFNDSWYTGTIHRNIFTHEYGQSGVYTVTITAQNEHDSIKSRAMVSVMNTPDHWKQEDGSYLFDHDITGSIVLDGDTIIDMSGYCLYASVDVGDSTLVLKNAHTFRSITGKHVIVEGVSDASFDFIECEVLEIYGKGISTINFHHPAGDGRNVTIFPSSLGSISISESGKSDFTTTLTEGSSITIVNDLITIHGEASMDSPLEDRTIQVDGKLIFSDRDDIQTGVVMMNGSKITLKDVHPGYVGMELKAGSVHMTGTFTSEDGGSIILDGHSYVDGSVVLDGVTATIMSGSTFTVSKDSTIEGINGGGIDNNGTVLVYGSLKASVDNSDGITNFYEGSIGSNKVVGGTVNGVDAPMPVPDGDDPKKDNENKSDGIDTKTIVISLVVVGIIGIVIGRRFL